MRGPGTRYDPGEVTLERKAATSKAVKMRAAYRP